MLQHDKRALAEPGGTPSHVDAGKSQLRRSLHWNLGLCQTSPHPFLQAALVRQHAYSQSLLPILK